MGNLITNLEHSENERGKGDAIVSIKARQTWSLSNLQNGANTNIGLGYSAGSAITTGSNNIVIGGNNGASIATSSNNILIADGQGNLKLTIDSAHIFTITNGLQNFVDDAAAAGGGIPVNGLYRNGSVVMIRVA